MSRAHPGERALFEYSPSRFCLTRVKVTKMHVDKFSFLRKKILNTTLLIDRHVDNYVDYDCMKFFPEISFPVFSKERMTISPFAVFDGGGGQNHTRLW